VQAIAMGWIFMLDEFTLGLVKILSLWDGNVDVTVDVSVGESLSEVNLGGRQP
jgi:hypothetical protein